MSILLGKGNVLLCTELLQPRQHWLCADCAWRRLLLALLVDHVELMGSRPRSPDAVNAASPDVYPSRLRLRGPEQGPAGHSIMLVQISRRARGLRLAPAAGGRE